MHAKQHRKYQHPAMVSDRSCYMHDSGALEADRCVTGNWQRKSGQSNQGAGLMGTDCGPDRLCNHG